MSMSSDFIRRRKLELLREQQEAGPMSKAYQELGEELKELFRLEPVNPFMQTATPEGSE